MGWCMGEGGGRPNGALRGSWNHHHALTFRGSDECLSAARDSTRSAPESHYGGWGGRGRSLISHSVQVFARVLEDLI